MRDAVVEAVAKVLHEGRRKQNTRENLPGWDSLVVAARTRLLVEASDLLDVVEELLGQQPEKHGRSAYDPVRSVRISDEVWNAAKRRAVAEGLTMSQVIVRLVDGFAQGLIPMPRMVYEDSSPANELEVFIRENGNFLVGAIKIRADRLEYLTTHGSAGVGSEEVYLQNLELVKEYRGKADRLQELLADTQADLDGLVARRQEECQHEWNSAGHLPEYGTLWECDKCGARSP